jgi:hypothetical protein
MNADLAILLILKDSGPKTIIFKEPPAGGFFIFNDLRASQRANGDKGARTKKSLKQSRNWQKNWAARPAYPN